MTDTRGIIVERDRMVPARDGVVLATNVYRPDGPGPYPVLFERTPYDKSAPSRSERTAAVARPRSRTCYATVLCLPAVNGDDCGSGSLERCGQWQYA